MRCPVPACLRTATAVAGTLLFATIAVQLVILSALNAPTGDRGDPNRILLSDPSVVSPSYIQGLGVDSSDLNGDGVIDAADIQVVRTQIGQTLP